MTPHTEPASLDAWARATAPMLKDGGWAHAFRIAEHGQTLTGDPVNVWSRAQARALLAELDRIAGELTPSNRGMLLFLDLNPRSRYCPVFCSYEDTQALIAADLVEQHPKSGEVVTPLGRAVLARKAARR